MTGRRKRLLYSMWIFTTPPSPPDTPETDLFSELEENILIKPKKGFGLALND